MGKRSFLSFIILVYSGKFVLMAESWGTDAIVITRFLCIMQYFMDLEMAFTK